MNIIKSTFSALSLSVFVLLSCSRSKNTHDVTPEPPKDTAVTETEAMPTPETALSDTIGLYKLTNAEARTYIVDMYGVLSDMDQAVSANAPARMPALLSKQRELQSKQVAVQSALSEADRTLFKIYVHKIADKLDALATKMESL
jgi:hypothetical protein